MDQNRKKENSYTEMPMERIDWNEAWKLRRILFDHDHTPEYWDEFAPRFRKCPGPGQNDVYIDTFYEYSGIRPGDTIFDMGCASGTLAIPYALKGHEVYAADFSKKMLEYLMLGAEEAGVADRIHPIRLDWNEDWSVRELPVCDVAIASRSLIFDDLRESLKKIESVAKRKVCFGAWDTPTTHYDRRVAEAIGYDRPGYGCYVYILGELIDRDMLPELRFIRHKAKRTKYETVEELKRGIRDSFQYGLTPEQEEKLEKYFAENIREREKDGGVYYQLEGSEMATIAYISWSPAKHNA